DFLEATGRALDSLVPHTRGITAVIGAPCRAGGELWNGACIVHDGRVEGWAAKSSLHGAGPFDEHRYFHPGPGPRTFCRGPFTFTVCVGADGFAPRLEPGTEGAAAGPLGTSSAGGNGTGADAARVVLHLDARPFVEGEGDARE